MKKNLIASLLVIAGFFAPVFALSWSGLIDNNTKFSENHDFSELKLNQSNGLYLSLTSPINDNLSFGGEILYKFVLDANFKANANSVKHIVDCDLLQLTGNWLAGNGILGLKVGRFYAHDLTGAAFSQTSDGLSLSYNLSKISLNFYAGYTGLLNRLNVSMADNSAAAALDGRPANDVMIYALCPMYIPVIADFSYNTLFQKHTLGFEAEMFIPVNAMLSNKFYGTLSLKGPFSTTVGYDAAFTFGLLKFEKFMFDANANINLYMVKNSMITAGCELISWTNGSLIAFAPVSSRSFTADPSFAGGLLPKLSFMFAKNAFYGSLTGKGVIAMGTSDAKFHGIDISASAIYNLLSDVQLACDLAAFIGLDAFRQSSNYSATIKACLAF